MEYISLIFISCCLNLQVQIGSHSFTFDHVYGSTGSPSAVIFEECVAPLVDGLFHGYNAMVLAYGQVWTILFFTFFHWLSLLCYFYFIILFPLS